MRMLLRLAQSLCMCAALALTGSMAAAQQPGKPIRLFVPGPAGGSTDILARLIGQYMSEDLASPVIVENRPGATSIVSMQALANQPADGNSILLIYTSHVINPLIMPNALFDPIKDFAPIATLSSGPYVLTTGPAVPANTVAEFIAFGKKEGSINFGSPGVGSSNGLATQMFGDVVGLKMQEIPYQGAAPILVDLIGGRIHLYVSSVLSVLPHIKSGKIKALAVDSETRVSLLPDVPTLAEAGVRPMNMQLWFGIVALAGTPKPIVDRYSASINKILKMPAVVARLESQGGQPFISTPEQFESFLKNETAKYASVVKKPAAEKK